MNPNILNKNPLMFFDRAVNAQRSQLLTVMADAVSECRTAADQAAELNETVRWGLSVWQRSGAPSVPRKVWVVWSWKEPKRRSCPMWWHSFMPTCPAVCSTIRWEWSIYAELHYMSVLPHAGRMV